MADEFTFDPAVFEDPFGGQSGSFTGWDGDTGAFSPMVLDTFTGQWITPQQAMQIDPQAWASSFPQSQMGDLGGLDPFGAMTPQQFEFQQAAQNPLVQSAMTDPQSWAKFAQYEMNIKPQVGQIDPNNPLSLPSHGPDVMQDFQRWMAQQQSISPGMDDMGLLPQTGPEFGTGGGFLGGLGSLLGGLGTAKGIAGTLGGLTTLLGAAGVIQALTSGDRQTQQTVQRAVAAASPEERQAFATALQQAQGQPGAVSERLQARVPGEEQAYGAGLAGAQQQFQQAQQLQQILSPQLMASLGPLMQQQGGTLGALGPVSQGMAQGQLPTLSPELKAQVGQVFAGREQDINRYLDTALQGAIERARQQGFAGGLDLLQGAPPATALMAPALAEGVRQRGSLAGQQALSELELAQNLPMLGANIAQAYNTPIASRLAGLSNLNNIGQGAISPLLNIGQGGPQAQNQLIAALTALTNSQAQNRGSTQTQTTQAPGMTLLDAFAPTAQLLGGVGGLFGGLNQSGLLR